MKRLRIWWVGLALFLGWAGFFTWWALDSGKFQDSPYLLFFIQTFAGNWSPPKPDKLPSSWFVMSAAIAVALNLGALGVLGANLVSLVRLERKQLMNTSRLFFLRDAVIKDEIFKLFEARFRGADEAQLTAFQNDIEQAYKAGNSAWANSTLPGLLGKRAARDFLDTVAEEINQPPPARTM